MVGGSFYDLLLVNHNASVDEIKLAFKRRALQVHPDKGGSKEEFHLVYQALETLADPEARKKYDKSLTSSRDAARHGMPRKRDRCHRRHTKQAEKSSTKSRSDGADRFANRNGPKAAKTSFDAQTRQSQLLMKIRDLLKQLPRASRIEVISKQFSQEQRLILEKWMVDTLPPAQVADQPVAEAVHVKQIKKQKNQLSLCEGAPTLPEGTVVLASSSKGLDEKTSRMLGQRKRRSRRTPEYVSKSKLSNSGCVYKLAADSDNYRASIRFDSLDIHTGQCDLQTALEYLVILTSLKQKMLDRTKAGSSFEDSLHEALVLSASEQGRDHTELGLRFSILQSLGGLIGTGFQLQTPSLRNIKELVRLRNILLPFKRYGWKWGRGSMFGWYSPTHLHDAWKRFQSAVVDAWESVGADGNKYVGKLCAIWEANAHVRKRHLRMWETWQMAMQDKNKHRPRRLRVRLNFGPNPKWEREHMAQHDRERHRRVARVRCGAFDIDQKLSLLRKLLLQWKRLLEAEARLVDKEHRKLLRQKRKDRAERLRLEGMKRKRLREEERLRKEVLRQRLRMKSDYMMDHLSWI